MTMPDTFFRKLDEKEEKEFRQWARDQWTVWHPCVRDEIKKIILDDFAEHASCKDMDDLHEAWSAE